ncbi:N-acetyltransferase [Bacillus fungorum]
MGIILEKATESDAAVLFQMQIDSFKPLLNKYQDYETNPANESIEKTILRINNPSSNFYKMIIDSNFVGGICISQKEIPYKFWISPILIYYKKER